MEQNQLWYGDNLDILREHIASESVDLVYLDPPFNSKRSYNVLFKNKSGMDAQAQIEAFNDTWSWSQESDRLYTELVSEAPIKTAEAVETLRRLLGDNDMLAYLVMMTARLVELHRVLKPSGSLYLHCDPTASHYLKIVLDSIFGGSNFRNEIIWKRTGSHNDTKQGRTAFGSVHDVIFFYTKTQANSWHPYFTPYDDTYLAEEYRHVDGDERRYKEADVTAAKPGGDTSYEWRVKRPKGGSWEADLEEEYQDPTPGWEYLGVPPYQNRYWAYSIENMKKFAEESRLIHRSTGAPRLKLFADEMPGVGPQDVWTDIGPISAKATERLGYPTQKPLSLMERIISTSSEEGDVVLDPFCGCGTTIDAAQRMGRRWIGIDITYLSIDLIRKRLRATHTEKIEQAYELHGIPQDLSGAQALFDKNPFDFERWAVSLVDGQPNEKQVGDKGVDGIIRFPIDHRRIGRVVVSVKGGRQINPSMVRDLAGTRETQRAEMGVLVLLKEPTRGMKEAANGSGTFEHPLSGRLYSRIQIVSISDIMLKGKVVDMPTPLNPYIKAKQYGGYQMTIDEA